MERITFYDQNLKAWFVWFNHPAYPAYPCENYLDLALVFMLAVALLDSNYCLLEAMMPFG